MDAPTVWDNLAQAISDLEKPEGDYTLKMEMILAGVQLLFEFPSEEILAQVKRSALPTRALVSWLVFEGGRLPGVDPETVDALQKLYEGTCAPGQGIIPPPARAAGGWDS